jgi:hypothetical protein
LRTGQLAAQFEAYADWRRRLADSLQRLAEWLRSRELVEPGVLAEVEQTLGRLALDQLVVAFVAEFSRGKSELINAIFFADYGRRLLPTSAGRTTMCPTELLYTPTLPPSIRLLPIETRMSDEPLAEIRKRSGEWTSIALDLVSPERMSEALSEVGRTRRVPLERARELGLDPERDGLDPQIAAPDGMIDIPCWRHAVINFPHALLQRGLVVLDTPGLNAVGAEPELTLNLLPNAHAVVLVLAADTGVTRSDVDTWHRHVAAPGHVPRQGRFVVLNKIDTMWDELRRQDEVDREIDGQVHQTAATLGVPAGQVFAVSAQKGLVAKVTADPALLARSRLGALENALSRELLPAKREIVGEAARREARELVRRAEALLDARLAGVDRQLQGLGALRGRNRTFAEEMLERARREREAFDRSLDRLATLRNELGARIGQIVDLLSFEQFRRTAQATRKRIESSAFTVGVRNAMASFFASITADLRTVAARIDEIHALACDAYARFASELELERIEPPREFPIASYQKELELLERAYGHQVDTFWNLVSKEKYTLERRFFETIAARTRRIHESLLEDADAWLKNLLQPLEIMVREHQSQLRRRIEVIRRVHVSGVASELRVAELRKEHETLLDQVKLANQHLARLEHIADEPQELPLAANE